MKKKITTIDELVAAFNNRRLEDTYFNIMSSIDIHPGEYEKFYTWHSDHYTRNSLAKNEKFELLLICFEKGQYSDIHDFNTSNAWIHPVMGTLLEERYKVCEKRNRLEKVSEITLDAKQYSFVSEHLGIHKYTNIAQGRSASLNLYAKPVEKWNVFELDSSNSIEKLVARHAIYF